MKGFLTVCQRENDVDIAINMQGVIFKALLILYFYLQFSYYHLIFLNRKMYKKIANCIN